MPRLGGWSRARILIEASTESDWVARCLEARDISSLRDTTPMGERYSTRVRTRTSRNGFDSTLETEMDWPARQGPVMRVAVACHGTVVRGSRSRARAITSQDGLRNATEKSH